MRAISTLFRSLLVTAALVSLHAQPVVAPTPDQPVTARGEDVGGYNVTNSVETGYRFAVVGGDREMYRSDVNYRNGIRLLGGSLTANSKDGHGRLFDEIVVTTTGLGADPYQFASFRVQKNSLYRYDGLWRSSDYYNPGLVIAGGLHLMNTQRRMQDHELRLFPASHVQVRLGYARNTENGPALSSEQGLNNATLSVLPLFRNVRRDWNEYRLGADLDFLGFKLTLMRQWDFYKDDSIFTGALAGIPGVGSNEIGATQYGRSEPYHGENPGWLGNLNTSRKSWAVNARMTYVIGYRDFALNESGASASRNVLTNFQTVVAGTARRPAVAGDLSFSVFPTSRLTLIVNHSAQSYRIDGDASIIQLASTGQTTTGSFRYLGIRTMASELDANYRLTNRIVAYAGYGYSARRVRTVESDAFGFGSIRTPAGDAGSVNAPNDQSNHLNAGRLGLSVKPFQPLTINVDGEIGRDNHPFLPLNDRDYHTINGRVDYRVRKYRLGAAYRQRYNINSPVALSFHSSHSRDYSAHASWTPSSVWLFDASYNKLHVDTAGNLAFYAAVISPNRNTLQTGYTSLYLSNIHSVNLSARVAIGQRTTVQVGYNLTRDTGDGRPSSVPSDVTNPLQQVFSAVQTFPLSYHAPLARMTFHIRPKLQWNAGWQLYRYRQSYAVLTYLPNYHANTGYTSLSWSF
jgi:hypothetical protein